MQKFKVSLEDVPLMDLYKYVSELLEAYDFNTNPVYSGFGLHVYHGNNEIDQMVIDFSNNEIRMHFEKNFDKLKKEIEDDGR